MIKRNKIIVIAIAALILIGGSWLFIRLAGSKTPAGPALQAIPVNAFCIVGTRQSPETWKKLSQDNILWDDFRSAETIQQVTETGKLIDSLLKKKTDLYSKLSGNPVFFSLHCSGTDQLNYVISMSLPGPDWEDDAVQFAEETSGKKFSETKWKEVSILTSSTKKIFHLAIVKSVVVISDNTELLKISIDQLQGGKSLLQDKSFEAVMNTAGTNVDGNIYVNYDQLPAFASRQFAKSFSAYTQGLSRFAGWTEMDVSLKPNAARFNGFTSTDSVSYLGLFRNQQQQRIEITSVLPATTNNFAFFGLSNFKQWKTDLAAYNNTFPEGKERNRLLEKIRSEKGFDPGVEFGSWIGNEFCWLTDGSDPEENSFAVVASADIVNAKISLSDMASSASDSSRVDTASYAGYTMRRIAADGMLSALFGSPFDAITRNWYTTIRHYIVFANSTSALSRFIDAYESGKTMNNDRFYTDFASNLSQQANLHVYTSTSRSINLLKPIAAGTFAEALSAQPSLAERIEGFALQFSGSPNGLFFTNAFLRRSSGEVAVTGSIWETELDTGIVGKPHLVVNHNTKSLEIFVQDKNNTVYLISNTGKILWQKTLVGPVMSDVQQVDALKNNKLQLVFNTSEYIYALDRNGNPLTGFPIKLPAPSTNPVRVFDYDNNREYRLIIACNDKHVYNYDIKGKKVDGWKFGTTQDVVNAPVQHTTVEGKDYIIIADRAGRLSIVDRQGATRLKLKERISAPALTFTIEKGTKLLNTKLVSADSMGNVTKLSLTDALENISIQSFTTTQLFEYRDITGDGVREYIFLDTSKLLVYDQSKQLVMSQNYSSATFGRPQIFAFANNDIRVGVTCPGKNAIYLARSNGASSDGFPLFGNTAFSVGSLNNDTHLVLVTGGKDKFVLAYPVK